MIDYRASLMLFDYFIASRMSRTARDTHDTRHHALVVYYLPLV